MIPHGETDTAELRRLIDQHENSLRGLKTMLGRIENPVDQPNPLFKNVGPVPDDVPFPSSLPDDVPMPAFPRSVVPGAPNVQTAHPLPETTGIVQSSPLPPPPPPMEAKSKTLEDIQHWYQICFRPGLAAAMMYVIMPVIEKIIVAETPAEKLMACAELDVWGELTLAQRVVLQDLFFWIEQECTSPDSVIPMKILSNMAAVNAAYDAAM